MINSQLRLVRSRPDGVRATPSVHAVASNQTPLPSPVPGTVFRRLSEGGLLFSTETEVYFGVGGVGTRIWELLPPATQTVEEMVDILSAEYRDVSASQIRTDVERFLQELSSHGLVAITATPPDGGHSVR